MNRSDITFTRLLKKIIEGPYLAQAKGEAPSKISKILQDYISQTDGTLNPAKFNSLFKVCQKISGNLHKEINKEGGELSHTVFKCYIKELNVLGLKGQPAVDVIKEIIIMARHKRTVSIYFAQYFHNGHYTNAIQEFIAADPSTINRIPELNQPETTLISELYQSENSNNLPVNPNELLVDALLLTYGAEVNAEDNQDNILTKELTDAAWQKVKEFLASANHIFCEYLIYVISKCSTLNSSLKMPDLTAKADASGNRDELTPLGISDLVQQRLAASEILKDHRVGKVDLNTLESKEFDKENGGVNKIFSPRGILRAENDTGEEDFRKEIKLQEYIDTIINNGTVPNLMDYVSLQHKIESDDKLPENKVPTKYAKVDTYEGIFIGKELDKYFEEMKARPLTDVDRKKIKSISLQIMDLLRALSKSKIQHRDLHMHNLLVHEVGDGKVILKAIDFGKVKYGEKISGYPDGKYLFEGLAPSGEIETGIRNLRDSLKIFGIEHPKQKKHYPLHKLIFALDPNEKQVTQVLATMGHKLERFLNICKQQAQSGLISRKQELELIDLIFDEQLKFLQKYYYRLEHPEQDSTAKSPLPIN